MQEESNNYGDLIVLNGKESTIKISDIDNLQKQFDKTALEIKGTKIFIINDCEKLTLKAANSLLKFIEEPTGQTIGIFLTHSIESVIPTIISKSNRRVTSTYIKRYVSKPHLT